MEYEFFGSENFVPLASNHDCQIPEDEQVAEDLSSFTLFSNLQSNAYFWQEHHCNQEGELHGGLRGIAWRAMFRRRLYDSTKIVDVNDTRLLLNMTCHVMNNSADQNETFIAIMEDIVNRATGFRTAINLPTDDDSVNKRLKYTEFGIFGNLPHEDVFPLSGHAFVSLIRVMWHIHSEK